MNVINSNFTYSMYFRLLHRFFFKQITHTSGTLPPHYSPAPSTVSFTISTPTLTPTSVPTFSPVALRPPPKPLEEEEEDDEYYNYDYENDEEEEFTFYIMGDVPYNEREETLIVEQLQDIPSDAKFVVHVGDIMMSSRTNCKSKYYKDRAERFLNSPVPFFLIPGDNDYLECKSPKDAWEEWHATFHEFDQYWDHSIQVRHQPERLENFAFYQNGILFVAVHIVGGSMIPDQDEWDNRLRDCADWLRTNLNVYKKNPKLRSVVVFGHAEIDRSIDIFMDDFVDMVDSKLPKNMPVYYIHGDGHHFKVDRPYKKKGAPNLITLMVDSGGEAPPLKVTLNKKLIPGDAARSYNDDDVNVENDDLESVMQFDRQGGRYRRE
jgi:predicted phosphodiesterase